MVDPFENISRAPPAAAAWAVHAFTASGVVIALMSLLAVERGDFLAALLWLMLGLAVDGVDGSLARWARVKEQAPRIDGDTLDLIIDYLTYVFIPAYALFMSGLLPGWTGWIAIIAITYGSVIYFADTRMKTRDYSFAGFPACWNMVVLVLFALKPSFWVILLIVVALTVTMFTNVKFIHPVRTRRWRAISLPVCAAWVVFAVWAVMVDFHPESFARWGLLLTSLWLLCAGFVQQLTEKRA